MRTGGGQGMTTQERAFHAYYASMPDSELLQLANNRQSLIEVAQRVLAEEIQRRQLAVPEQVPDSAAQQQGIGNRISRLIRHRN